MPKQPEEHHRPFGSLVIQAALGPTGGASAQPANGKDTGVMLRHSILSQDVQ